MDEVFQKITQMGNVTSLYYKDPPAGWTHWLLLVSDNHHDSVFCNRELELAHLEEAKKRNADIFYFGDLFDAMQGKFDPRRSMDELRPEYRRQDYYDFVVEDTANFLAPYASQIRLLGKGNHETAVLKNANIDLMNRLAFMLNIQNKTSIQVGGYGGWVRLMFTLSANETGPTFSLRMKYFHGAGAEAPVTRGVIQTNRQAVYLPDANMVINGHNHNAYYVPITRERLTTRGQIYYDVQHHIRIPGYKMDYADGAGGFIVEKGGVPKPIGVFWVKLTLHQAHGVTGTISMKPEPDIQGPETMPSIMNTSDPFFYDEDGATE